MAKSFLSILLITSFLTANIVLGQEGNPADSSLLASIGRGVTDSSVAVHAAAVTTRIALQKLSPEELDQIVGEGLGDFLPANNKPISSVPWIILWDEIAKQGNTSTGGSIEVTSTSSFMNGIRMNSVYK